MADFFNPKTGEIITSVHVAPSVDWIKNPAGVRTAQAIPVHYRVIKDGRVQEADKTAKAAVDKQRLPAVKAAKKAALAEEARERLALADPEYKAAAASVDAAKTIDDVKAVRLTAIKLAI